MDIAMLFTGQPLDAASLPAANSTEISNGSKNKSGVAVPFSQALKVLAKNSQEPNNTAGEVKTPVDQGSQASEQIALLLQTTLPFVTISEEEPATELPLGEEQVLKNPDKQVFEYASERLQTLFEKANQLQQEIHRQTNQQAGLQAQMFKSQPTEQTVIQEAFGDKLVQEKIPELVADNDLQQKLLAAQKADGQVKQMITEEHLFDQDKILLQKHEGLNLFQQTGESLQNQGESLLAKDSAAEISLERKPESKLDAELTIANTGLATNQTKELAPQKISLDDPTVKFDDVKEMVDKMVEQARLTQKPGISEMVIKLKPQHLGEMTIRIIAGSGGSVAAAFHSNNAEVRGLLQESLPAIRQELANSGLKVHDVGVYAGLSDFQSFAGHDQRSLQDQQIDGGSINRLTKEDQELLEELQLAKNGENQSNDGGVDYRV